MRLEFLKRFVRIKERIVVFEADDHAERNAIVAQAINPAAAVKIGAERPAERVRDIAGFDAAGLHVPQFLDADAVDLGIQAVELERLTRSLVSEPRGPSASTVTFARKLVAGREIVFGLAVFVDALVFGEDAGDAVLFVEQFPARELREKR